MAMYRKGCKNICRLWGEEDKPHAKGIKNNKVGMQYGELIVLEKLEKGNYLCYCSCGNYIKVPTADLRDNIKKCKTHCGCLTVKYSKNVEYFSEINTPEKAYILGFISADGTIGVSKNSKRVKITLNYQDKEILEKIAKELNFNHKIKEEEIITTLPSGKKINSRIAEINICSNKICEDLSLYGIIPNKTYTIDFPDKIPKEYKRDFIRGVFDGDGSFGIYCDKSLKKISYDAFRLTGSKNMLNQISQILSEELQIDNIKVYEQGTKSICDIKYNSKENFKKILNYLYKDSTLYLSRKYNKYLNCLFLFDYIEEIRKKHPIQSLPTEEKDILRNKIKQLGSNGHPKGVQLK